MDSLRYLFMIAFGIVGFLGAEQDLDEVEAHWMLPGFVERDRTPKGRKNSISLFRLVSAILVVVGCVGLLRSFVM